MPFYHVAFSGKAGTNSANKIIANLWLPTRLARVYEVGIFIQTVQTTAPLFALQRSTARGTQTATYAPIKKDTGDPAADGTLDITWSVDPTFSSAAPHIRTAGVPLAIGNGTIWNLGELECGVGSGLALFNITATGATAGSYNGYFYYEE